MSAKGSAYKMVVLTRRIKMPGIVETMSEQVPEVKLAFLEIEEMLHQRLEELGEDQWRIVSHAQNIHNGIVIVSVILEPREPTFRS